MVRQLPSQVRRRPWTLRRAPTRTPAVPPPPPNLSLTLTLTLTLTRTLTLTLTRYPGPLRASRGGERRGNPNPNPTATPNPNPRLPSRTSSPPRRRSSSSTLTLTINPSLSLTLTLTPTLTLTLTKAAGGLAHLAQQERHAPTRGPHALPPACACGPRLGGGHARRVGQPCQRDAGGRAVDACRLERHPLRQHRPRDRY